MKARELSLDPDALGASAQPPVRLRWLGTAGVEIACEGRRLLIDPFLSRPSLPRCLVGPLAPDRDRIQRYVAAADGIVVGHTHFDHALDVPAIAQLTGATVLGSRSAMTLCRSAGLLGAQLLEAEPTPTETVTARFGPFAIRCTRSAHSPIAAGRVPFPGAIAAEQGLPLWAHQYRCGTVLATTVEVAGRRIVHLGSAAVEAHAQPRQPADLLLLCVSGWHTAPEVPERAVRTFAPRQVLLTHWDDFFRPLHRPLRQLPAVRLRSLVRRLRTAAGDITIGTVEPLAPIGL